MRVCFATKDSLNSVWQDKISMLDNHDLLVFGFNGLGLVSYKKELCGETEYFHIPLLRHAALYKVMAALFKD